AGLSRAIDKAHGAVAESQRYAEALERNSARGSSPSAMRTSARASSPAGATATGGTPGGPSRAPARQAEAESALRHGKIAVVLFWSPKGADDLAVRAELQRADSAIAVFEASPSEVTSFGSITRTVRIDQTPTIVIVNPHGRAATLTGLTDAYSIEQAIDT